MNRIRRSIVTAGIVAAVMLPGTALASSPGASCIGQQLSVYGPAYGAALGAQVAYEARDPGSIGVSRLGEWVSWAARSDRTACPVD